MECLVQLFGVSPSLSSLGKQSVQDLKLAKLEGIVNVKENNRAVDAFRLMCEHNVSGLPVVRYVLHTLVCGLLAKMMSSDDGKLVGNISESDLRAIQSNAQYLKLLYLPVSEYLEVMKLHHRKPLVKCEQIDTYKQIGNSYCFFVWLLLFTPTQSTKWWRVKSTDALLLMTMTNWYVMFH